MFFDEPKVDRVYQDLLLAIAKKQQELFRWHFDNKSYFLCHNFPFCHLVVQYIYGLFE